MPRRASDPPNASSETVATSTDNPTGAKRAIFTVVVVLLSLVVVEICSFVAVGILVRRGWMAYVPRFSDEQMEFYLREHDRTLGWAFVTDSTWGSATDSAGTITRPIPRPDPAFASGRPCVSTYGDSFVYGTEASDSGSYPHHLATLLGCPVRNFGVPAYGSDQALMLFRAQAEVDSAPIVIFQHLTENVLRNVNRYANLLYPGSPLRFKPRFVLSRDSLEYLPTPVTTEGDFARVTENPDSALAPDGLLDRPRAGFPFIASLIHWLATDVKMRARITGIPIEAGYYAPDHPAGGFGLTVGILTASVRDAAAQGRVGVILLQSTRQGLIHGREKGSWMDQALYDTLSARGLPVIHGGPRLLAALGGRDPCELFDDCAQTHLTSEGNRIVAGIIADFLAARTKR